jgi:hypothetical protein
MGSIPAVFAAILYQYAPYHAVDIYVRGALSEVWAIALVPFVCMGIVDLLKKKNDGKILFKSYYHSIAMIAISYALLIITHNITAMLLSLFIFVGMIIFCMYVLIRYLFYKHISIIHIQKLGIFCLSLAIGLCLSAFFWVPAFFESNYTNVNSAIEGSADYRDHFVYLEQLWDSPWGFGGSVKGKADGLSFKVGKMHVIFGIFSLLLLAWQTRFKTAKKGLIVYAICLVVTILFAVFMTNQLSQPFWDFVPIFAYIQYPWRLLLFITFGFSLLSATLFTFYKNIFFTIVGILIIFTIMYVNLKYFVPQYHVILDPSIYKSKEYSRWWISKISDEYMPIGFTKPLTRMDIVSDKFILNSPAQKVEEEVKTTAYKLAYISSEDTNLHINLAYFPEWSVMIDKKSSSFVVLNNGIDVAIPKGKHTVDVKRTDTLIESISNSISLFSFILVFGTMMRSKYIYVKKTKR